MFVNSLNDSARGRELEFMFPTAEEEHITQKHLISTAKFDVNFKEKENGKVNKICDALKQSLEKVNTDNKYLLPILTTYIKR